jgi:3-dehydroquinate synthase
MQPALTFENYQVHFIDELPQMEWQDIWKQYPSIFILVDANTRAYCLPPLLELAIFKEATILEIPAGEDSKNLNTCQHLWNGLLDEQAGRDVLLVNLGGGMVSDLGGFVAGAYKRGIHFINIPTTLLAMVDATVGAKTGINLGGIKNSVGLFNQPQAIFIHLPFLETLPYEELLSGYAEMLKHALLSGKEHWEALMDAGPQGIKGQPELIVRSLKVKQDIVAQDPEEAGLRKTLNLGHTIGHALESEGLRVGKPLLHGHAVALGMVAELWLSHKLLGFPQKDLEAVSNYLVGLYGRFLNIELSLDKLAELVGNDKKNRSKQLSFSLLQHIGKPEYDCAVSRVQLLEALVYLRGRL